MAFEGYRIPHGPCSAALLTPALIGPFSTEAISGPTASEQHENPLASRASTGQAHQTVDVLQARRSEHKKSKADDRGTGIGGKYFRTKKAPSVGAGITGKNEPRELSTVKPEKNKLDKQPGVVSVFWNNTTVVTCLPLCDVLLLAVQPQRP